MANTYAALAKLGDGGLQGEGQLMGSITINIILVAYVFKSVIDANRRMTLKLNGYPVEPLR